MVTLNIGGKSVSWAEAEKLFAETGRVLPIEFRDDSGRIIATSSPALAEPDWVSSITPEETTRRLAGPFLTLEDYRKEANQQ